MNMHEATREQLLALYEDEMLTIRERAAALAELLGRYR